MRPTTATEHDLPADLGALYAEEGPRLWRAVFAFARDREIASDAVAEAFAQCLRRGAEVRDPRAWMWRSSFRIAAGELKRRGTTTDLIPEHTYEMPDDPASLLDALERLSPTQRAVLVLRHYLGEPTERRTVTLTCPAPVRDGRGLDDRLPCRHGREWCLGGRDSLRPTSRGVALNQRRPP